LNDPVQGDFKFRVQACGKWRAAARRKEVAAAAARLPEEGDMDKLSTAARPSANTPWSLEQTLLLALAGVVIIGWALVYMTLMRGIDRPEVARDATRTAISANLPPPR
jgi:hypothetical protein